MPTGASRLPMSLVRRLRRRATEHADRAGATCESPQGASLPGVERLRVVAQMGPRLFTRVTVAQRVGNTARLDAETKFMGLRMRRTERHVLAPPEKVEGTGDVPDATNTTVWKFEAVPEGTMLTAVIEFQFKGMLKLLQPIAEWQARTVTRKWMQAFATYVENESSRPAHDQPSLTNSESVRSSRRPPTS